MKKLLFFIALLINTIAIKAQEPISAQLEDGTIVTILEEGLLFNKYNEEFFIYNEPKEIIETSEIEVFQVQPEGALCFTREKGQILFLIELGTFSYYDKQIIHILKNMCCVVIGIHTYLNKDNIRKTIPIVGIKNLN